jgi:hypothetical protein
LQENCLPVYEFITESFGIQRTYNFSADEHGYVLNITNQGKHFDKECHDVEMYWENSCMIMRRAHSAYNVYDSRRRVFTFPEELFQEDLRPILHKKNILILDGEQNAVAPFFGTNNIITYTDEWQELPASIPADIIVIGDKKYPIQDIIFRLPSNANVIVLRPDRMR